MFCLQQMSSYLVKGEKSCLCKNGELSKNDFLLWRCVKSNLCCALIFFPLFWDLSGIIYDSLIWKGNRNFNLREGTESKSVMIEAILQPIGSPGFGVPQKGCLQIRSQAYG